MIRLHIMVSGDVQGVGFRYFTQMKAIQYQITGWVKNSSNGNVEMIACGEEEDIKAFLNEIRHGHPFSKIKDLSYREIENIKPLHSFIIKY